MKRRYLDVSLVILSVLLLAAFDAKVCAQDISSKQSLTIRGEYFVPARKMFRDIYQDSFGFGLQYERRVANRINISIEAGYLFQDTSQIRTKYTNLYVVPGVTYRIDSGGNVTWYCGLGVGLNFRKISADIEVIDRNAVSHGIQNFSYSDFGPSINISIGSRSKLSQSMFLITRVAWDFIYDSKPELGDFGNTGGVNFSFGLGISF